MALKQDETETTVDHEWPNCDCIRVYGVYRFYKYGTQHQTKQLCYPYTDQINLYTFYGHLLL